VNNTSAAAVAASTEDVQIDQIYSANKELKFSDQLGYFRFNAAAGNKAGGEGEREDVEMNMTVSNMLKTGGYADLVQEMMAFRATLTDASERKTFDGK
jgi:hypothetical protein